MLRTITNPIVARPQSALNYLNDHNLIINDFVQVLNTKLDSTNQQVSLDKFEIDLKLLALECLFWPLSNCQCCYFLCDIFCEFVGVAVGGCSAHWEKREEAL